MILAPLRNDDVGVSFGRLNKLEVHWFNKLLIVLKHLLERSSSFFDVTPDNPHQPVITIGIHIDFDVHAFS
jgi:hypothetical protein